MLKTKVKIALLTTIVLLFCFAVAAGPVGRVHIFSPEIESQQVDSFSLVYQPYMDGRDAGFALDGFTWAG